MSWLSDVKTKKQLELEKVRDWGYMCGNCKESFFADYEAYIDHIRNGHKTEFSETYQKATGDKYHIGDKLAV